MSFLTRLFGDPNARVIEALQPVIEQINALEPELGAVSVSGLRERSDVLRARAKEGAPLEDLLPSAFALVREAAKRTLNQRHYDVQLMGGIVLHRGGIAEMRTGEGKTLTSTLAVYLNAIAGLGSHVVTVNDYLARRDAVWMGQVYDLLGLTVGCINHDSAFRYDASWRLAEGSPEDRERDETGSFLVKMDYLRPVERGQAYLCDVTYGTNNEFGFDHLRDNMVMRPEARVQKPFNFAVVDEVDSILIDEARTPLIISAPAEEAAETYYRFADLVRRLAPDADYNIDEKMRAVALTEEGITKIERMLGIENLYEAGGIENAHHVEQALRAEALFKNDRDYVVKDGEVIIVDEFTGRLMQGRRYSEGLHQAIEAKEGVRIQRESRTLATITFQNYFRLYPKLAGMTGTAATEAEEFSKIYNLDVTVIPPNRETRRADLTDRVYKNERAKFDAAVAEIKERNGKGQPVLVGTISIEKNEVLGELLRREGVPHELLNAKNHEREARIIAQAGRFGAVTVATNMAGRGVDIILGGNPPSPEEAEKIRGLGGLCVIGTERHESRRIDNQLRGRSGRQGDPGETLFFVSLADDLMRIFGSGRMQSLMERLGIPDDMPIEHKMVSKSIESAQRKVEGHHFDMRKHLLEYDDVLNKHREVVYRKRADILGISVEEPEKIRERALETIEQEIEQVVLFHTAAEDESVWDLKEIEETAATIFPAPPGLSERLGEVRREAGSKLADANARERIVTHLMELARAAYDDAGRRAGEITGDSSAFASAIKGMMLRAIDMHWVGHLDAMEHLRTGIGLRGYGQRDPLVEYKREAYRMFTELLGLIGRQIAQTVFKIAPSREQARPAFSRVEGSLMERSGVTLSAPAKTAVEVSGPASAGQVETSAVPSEGGAVPKVGRNDPCPCGSGKKYKKCHGA